MGLTDILLLAVALSMDAAAVSMTHGMTDPKMPLKRVGTIAGFFGSFQAIMPLIGYFITKIVANAFLDVFEKASAWTAFVLLAFLGGKMIFDGVKEMFAKRRGEEKESNEEAELSIGKLFVQAIATSIDALAVGVALQMAAISPEGLFPSIGWTVLIIGCTTFLLSVLSVYIGKLIGNKLADKAELLGGVVLVAIGLKILLEALL
jgi:putative Mn2+ efflux pump MntP